MLSTVGPLRRDSRKGGADLVYGTAMAKLPWFAGGYRPRTDPMEHRALVGVECPECHGRQFVELGMDLDLEDSPVAEEIERELREWLRSRCPNHLGSIMKKMKN